MRPSSSMASWLPTGRGDEPQVLTTVARATALPARRQSAAWLSTSSWLIASLMTAAIITPAAGQGKGRPMPGVSQFEI